MSNGSFRFSSWQCVQLSMFVSRTYLNNHLDRIDTIGCDKPKSIRGLPTKIQKIESVGRLNESAKTIHPFPDSRAAR